MENERIALSLQPGKCEWLAFKDPDLASPCPPEEPAV